MGVVFLIQTEQGLTLIDSDVGCGIAVDSSGNAYVNGSTLSEDFPTFNAFQGSSGGGGYLDGDAFVTKLNASGNALVYSTYLGGSDRDGRVGPNGGGGGIALDSSGNAYVTSITNSPDFPTVNAFQDTFAGGGSFENEAGDVFVAKIGDEPTVVKLINFTVNTSRKSVVLEWETATEIDNAGFHIWRKGDGSKNFTRITANLIPAKGGETWGAEYLLTDKDVHFGRTYEYRLEDVELDGTSTLHEAVAVTVRAVNIIERPTNDNVDRRLEELFHMGLNKTDNF